jgi:hypothetical protein
MEIRERWNPMACFPQGNRSFRAADRQRKACLLENEPLPNLAQAVRKGWFTLDDVSGWMGELGL